MNTNYTRYGEFARVLRVKYHQTMTDMAKLFNVSAAFLCNVELGKKVVPKDWPRKLIEYYQLDEAKQQELFEVIEISRPVYRIDAQSASNKQREAAMYFSKYLHQLDDDTADQIINIFKRNRR